MSHVIIFEVTGMHCAACERVVSSVLAAVPGVTDVEVSLRQERAAIRLSDDASEPDIDVLNAELRATGHALYPQGKRPIVCENPSAEPLSRRLRRAFLAFFVLATALSVYSFLRPFVPAVTAAASVGSLFALGVVASLSTCLASTGAFFMAYAAQHSSRWATLGAQVGRLVAFVVGGALLGGIGQLLPSGSQAWYGIIGLLLAVGFLAVGLNLLAFVPPLSRLGIRLPSGLSRLADRVARSKRPYASLAVGAVTFVLPCGFTQTAQALAIASGSARQGAFLLGAFALGTLPVLLGLTWFSSLGAFRSRFVQALTGAALVLFAFGQIDGSLTVLGSSFTFSGAFAAVKSRVFAADVAEQMREQIVRMTVAYGTYSPKNLVVKKGVPVRWEIDGEDISGCANTLVMPTYGITKTLAIGSNTITFTPTEAGTIPFSCGMGMIRGSFTVIN